MHLASPSEQIKVRQFAQSAAVTAAMSVVKIGNFHYIALNESEANAENAYVIESLVKNAEKTTGEAWAAGQKLYYDPATSKFTTTAGALALAGRAAAPALSADTTGSVDFNTYTT
jgi:predicted RecA/RadA family phage recombinase